MCKTRCRSDVILYVQLCTLIVLQQVLPLTRNFSWSLAASKPLSQFVAVWLIREAHSIVLRSGNCTEHPLECSVTAITLQTVTVNYIFHSLGSNYDNLIPREGITFFRFSL